MNRANNTEKKLNEWINGGRLRAHLSLVRALMVPYHLEETLGRKEQGHFPANDQFCAPRKGTEGQPRSAWCHRALLQCRRHKGGVHKHVVTPLELMWGEQAHAGGICVP